MGSIPVPSAKYDNQLWRGNPIAGDGTRLESGRSVKTLAGSTPVPSANFWKIKPTAGDGTGFESRRGESPYEFDPRIFRQFRPRNLQHSTSTQLRRIVRVRFMVPVSKAGVGNTTGGSNPSSSAKCKCSSVVERLVANEKVAGSIPVSCSNLPEHQHLTRNMG